MDAVFRALADPGRRALLDALRDQDGQTLGELCAVLPDLTRFGVMKHLDVLAGAHLVTTRREGRVKRHFLNPVPIREIHDRWISRYAEPWVTAMVELKRAAEADAASDRVPDPTPPSPEPHGAPEPWPPATSSRPTSAPRPSASGPR